MLRFIILLLFSGAALCLNGQKSCHELLHECTNPRPPSVKSKDHGGNIKDKINKCLQDSKCKPLPNKEGGPGKEKGEGKEKANQVQQCIKPIADKLRKDLEACVQKKYPKFQLPEEKKRGFGQLGGGHGPSNSSSEVHANRSTQWTVGHRRGWDLLAGLVNSSCPDEKSKAAAKSCLSALKPQGREGNKTDFKALRQQICKKKVDCFKKLTPSCQNEINGTKAQFCKCAKDTILPQSAQINASVKKCLPQSNQAQAIDGKSLLDRFVKKFCDNDPCQEQPKF